MPEGESGRTKAIKHCTSKWPGPTHATGSDVVLGCAETYHGHLCCPLASLPGSMGTDERKPPRGGGFHSSIAWKSANGLEQRESRPGGLLHSQGSFGAVRLGTLPCAHNFNLARWGGGGGVVAGRFCRNSGSDREQTRDGPTRGKTKPLFNCNNQWRGTSRASERNR